MQLWLDQYLKHLEVNKRLARRTIEMYHLDLERLAKHSQIENLDAKAIQTHHIRHWVLLARADHLSPRSIALRLSVWRGFFRWLVDLGEITSNPCLGVKGPKAAKPLPKALGVDAAMALANFQPQTTDAPQAPWKDSWIGARDTLIVELLYGCGLRVSELVGLDVTASNEAMRDGRGWIDEQAREVHVFGKGSKRRMVPLGAKALEALLVYKPYRMALSKDGALEAALLIGSKGKRITRAAVWALLRSRSLAAGLTSPVHPHMLRHSFASHVLQSSGDLRAVQELLGHSSIASTQVYTKLDFQHLAQIYDNSHPRAKIAKGKI